MSTATAIVTALSLQPIDVRHENAARSHGEGPGWFDSSWELRSGLQVKEGLPSDLGVCAWIESWLHLAGAQGGTSLAMSAA